MTWSLSVDLLNVSDADDLPTEEQMRAWVEPTLQASTANYSGGFELAVRLVGESESQALNSRYRQQDKATNVLSFPFGPMAGLPVEEVRFLGDLVICVPVVEREARDQKKPVLSHWAHLVVHGTLHLLGHDHEDDAEAAAMEALEITILRSLGIQDPYLKN